MFWQWKINTGSIVGVPKKILVVDDDKIIVSIIKFFLGAGYEIVSAGSGKEAFTKLVEFNPDVILLDVVLPDISGLDVFIGISESEEYKDIPIIMLTSLECNEEISSGLETGCFDYIQKPVNRLELVARINAAYKLKNYIKKVNDANRENEKLIGELQKHIEQEEAIKETVKQAEVLRTVQELAGSIAHEFSQPLQVLTLYYGLMEKQPHRTDFFAKSKLMIDRISNLVHKLKSITRLEKQDYAGTQILNLHASANLVETICNIHTVREIKSVLVAEDETGILESIVELLQLNGYDCQGAQDGQTALYMARTKSYDLIISDINMPNLTGIELYNELKKLNFAGYFIYMTGYEVSGEIRKSLEVADGIVMKPFEFKDFLNKIEILKQP